MRQLAARHPLRLLAAFVAIAGLGIACSSDGGGDDAPDEPTGTVTWCQVSEVLVDKCQRCHVGQGMHGAPFPLVTYADTQVDMGGRPRWAFMETAVDGEVMPPANIELDPPAEKPTAAERELLLTWFDEGAKAVGGLNCD